VIVTLLLLLFFVKAHKIFLEVQ